MQAEFRHLALLPGVTQDRNPVMFMLMLPALFSALVPTVQASCSNVEVTDLYDNVVELPNGLDVLPPGQYDSPVVYPEVFRARLAPTLHDSACPAVKFVALTLGSTTSAATTAPIDVYVGSTKLTTQLLENNALECSGGSGVMFDSYAASLSCNGGFNATLTSVDSCSGTMLFSDIYGVGQEWDLSNACNGGWTITSGVTIPAGGFTNLSLKVSGPFSGTIVGTIGELTYAVSVNGVWQEVTIPLFHSGLVQTAP